MGDIMAKKQKRGKIKSAIKAIRAFCVHCMGNQAKLVAGCTAPECPLFDFRQGLPKQVKKANSGSFKGTSGSSKDTAIAEGFSPRIEDN